jgi:hypothetical protein
MKIVKILELILSLLGLEFLENKLVKIKRDNTKEDVSINKKPILLQYDNEKVDKREPFILFNPLGFTKNGTYFIFEKYGLEEFSLKFNDSIINLLKYASNPNLQNEKTSQLHPLIINLNKLSGFSYDSEIFENILEKWKKINEIVQKQSSQNIYIHFNLRRQLIKTENDKVKNPVAYQPIIKVTFPLYELLKNKDNSQILGIDIDLMERKILLAIYEFIFQNIQNDTDYEFPKDILSLEELYEKGGELSIVEEYISYPLVFFRIFIKMMSKINTILDLLSSIDELNIENKSFNLLEIEELINKFEKVHMSFDSFKDGYDGLGKFTVNPYTNVFDLNNEINKKNSNALNIKSTSNVQNNIKNRSLNSRFLYPSSQSGFLFSRPNVIQGNFVVTSNCMIQTLDPTDEENFNLIISPEAARYHRHFLGGSGIGKSEGLKVMAIKDIQDENSSFILLDGGQKLALELARQIDNPTRLVYIDESLDENYKISINPLDTKDKNPKNLAIMSKHITKSFELIMESEWSTNMEAVILPVIYILMEIGGFDIKDIKKFMDEANYEELCELALKSLNEDHKNFILNDFNRIKSIKSTRDAIFMKLQSLISDGSINNCITGESTLNLEELVNTPGKILIIKPESNAFGIFIMSMIQGIAEKRDVHNFIHTNFYIDEFSNYVSPSATKILSELRKKGLHLTMAHQELDQIKNIKNNIFANTHIKIVGKSSYEDLKTMAKELQINVKELESLGIGEFYIKVATNKSIKIKVTDKFIDQKAVMSEEEWKDCIKHQLENYYSKSEVIEIDEKKEELSNSNNFKSKLKSEFKLASKSISNKLADF